MLDTTIQKSFGPSHKNPISKITLNKQSSAFKKTSVQIQFIFQVKKKQLKNPTPSNHFKNTLSPT
jgi:hypothetical protein